MSYKDFGEKRQHIAVIENMISGLKANIDYKLIASFVDSEKDAYTLQIYAVRNGVVAPTSHNNLGFYGLDKLIAFVSGHGFIVSDAWHPLELEEDNKT